MNQPNQNGNQTESFKPVQCLALVREDGQIYIDSLIKSQADLTSIIEPGSSARVVTVEVREHKKRSLPANALLHKWLAIVSETTGENERSLKNRFKRDFGYPVLQREQPEKARKISYVLNKIGYESYSDEQQLSVWDLFEVTSIMSTKELRQAMDTYKNFIIDTLGFELTNGR